MLKSPFLFLFSILLLVQPFCAQEPEEICHIEEKNNDLPEHLIFGIPGGEDMIISRKGFSLGYSRKRRQALWVSYILTAEQCTGKKVKRSHSFKVDPAIRNNPVRPRDYRNSGYDKGHLASAADMAKSPETMRNSFYMSNISPQIPGCNRGIWKRLETQVRRWAVREGKLCVVTGPVFKKRNKRIKESKLPVPYAFYKVILDMTPPVKMIGFIVPNETSYKQISAFAVSVNTVEELTGYDFFASLEDSLEEKLESHSSYELWK